MGLAYRSADDHYNDWSGVGGDWAQLYNFTPAYGTLTEDTIDTDGATPSGIVVQQFPQTDSAGTGVFDAFFGVGVENDKTLYKIRVDGTDLTKLSSTKVITFQILNDDLYFITEEPCLWRMKKNGSEPVKLSDDITLTFNSTSDWIYYDCYNWPEKPTLKKMRLNGSEASVVSQEEAVNLHVLGDWLVYFTKDDQSDDGLMVFLKVDGTSRIVYRPEPVN